MKKYSFIIAAFALVAATGCKKQLEQYDPESFSEANAFRTFEHVQNGTNEAYGRYSTYANDMYKSALVSDEAKLGFDNAGQGALTYRYQYSSDATTGGDVTGGYGGYYSVIDQVNRVLPHVYTVTPIINTPLPQSRRDEINGQLLALRAIAHFGLLQGWAKNYDPADARGIAVVTVSNSSSQPARSSIGDAITQIEKDLADAKALLPAVTVASFRDTVMNKVNVAAYQARIALWKRDYAAAITYATEVINSGVKPLSNGTAFQSIWTDAGTSEVLFRIRYATSTGIGGLWTTTGNLIYIAPSDKLVAAYATADIRKATFIGTTGAGNNYVNKFYTSSRGGRVVDMKACRIAEMYLIRAEAYARQSSPNVALGAADLNLLRTNRITGYTDQTFASATALADAVMDERFKELCFEGFRIFDLKRNNLPVQRNASDAQAAWQTLPAGNYRFVFPIPNAAILANPNIVQNDGY